MANLAASLLQGLEDSSCAEGIRQSLWMYPALEIVHISGIAVLVGSAFLFDLRLLGFSTHLPVSGLAQHLLTWSRRGLFLVIPSGFLLFITNAVTLGADPVFWTKIFLLLLAGLNATVFHRFRKRSYDLDHSAMPLQAKAAAVFSIILWIAVIACGRLLAY